MAERRKALELLGYALHCVGLAAKGRAKAQKIAARKSKRIEKQGHGGEEIGQATELHCRAYAKALKGDALHRHRGAVTRRAKEMGSIDKRGVSLAEKRFGIA